MKAILFPLIVLCAYLLPVTAAAQCKKAPPSISIEALAKVQTSTDGRVEELLDMRELRREPDLTWVRSFEVEGVKVAIWSENDGPGWHDLMVAPVALGDSSLGTDMIIGRSDVFGGNSKLEGVYAADLVDGSEKEIIVIFTAFDQSRGGTWDDDHDDESGGAQYQQVVLLDLSLKQLAEIEAWRDSSFDQHGETCSATLSIEDIDCDGRRELISRRSCEDWECAGGGSGADCGEPRREVLSKELEEASPPLKSSQLPTSLIADDRPYLVIAGSFASSNADSRGMAERIATDLRSEGHGEAKVHDSRQFEELACCFFSVIAGRFASREEAEEYAESVRFEETYVKKGFYQVKPLPEVDEGCSEAGVLPRRRGYRLRLLQCGNELRVESYNAAGKRRKKQVLLPPDSESSLESPVVRSLPDENGITQALVLNAAVSAGDKQARLLILMSGDKDDSTLPYAALLPAKSTVEIVGDQVLLNNDGATRTITLKNQKTALTERGQHDQRLLPPEGLELSVKAEDIN